jgi:hypothetical protein
MTLIDDADAEAARDTLELGTGDSPQFTAVNLGHATDTTIARSGAGDITIEGNAVYRAGGTDVPVADGGTGASTAAAAATNLGLGTGDSPQFTAVNIGHATDTTVSRSGAGDIAVEGNVVYRAGGTDVALADGGTGASLVDPDADRVLFWDDSAGQVTWLSLHSNLEISGTTLKPKHRGALVKKSVDQTTADYSAGAFVAFDTEVYDTDGFHDNASNNSRLTVPAGVTKVRVGCGCRLSSGTSTDWTSLAVSKNGSRDFPGAGSAIAGDTGSGARLNCWSAIVTVVEGDYFEAFIQTETDTSITVGQDATWLSIEVIE